MNAFTRNTALLACLFLGGIASAQENGQPVNDSNTPLHLLKPAYRVGYGVVSADDIKQDMDRVLRYLQGNTPTHVTDSRTGERITDYARIDRHAQLERGAFRLASYEWGVTYSAMQAAYEATGDKAYQDYVYERFRFLAEVAPYFRKAYEKEGDIDPQMRQILMPKALDDAGAVCAAMLKAQLKGAKLPVDDLIDNYFDFIINKEYRLDDGTFARNRPYHNSVWLDDMFMGIPAVALMGSYDESKRQTYYDEAVKQIRQFADRMFVSEKGLFRHGWVEGMTDHPAFHWGRANGWAILTMCEVLDVLPENYEGREDILNHAINKGWIDAMAYGPVVQLGWHAVSSAINEKGEVEGVCVGTGMGFDPAFYYYRPVNVYAAHGYGPVIWAGAEMICLLKQQHPRSNDSAVLFYRTPQQTEEPIFNEE